MDHKLAIIVVTIGRYKGIKTLLDSIENQALKADLVIIVDANKQYSEDKVGKYSFPVKYIHTGPNSLTEARNIGIGNVPDGFELICFLDDDTALCDNAMANMHSFWRKASLDTGGAAFNVVNFPPVSNMRAKELFVLNSPEKGRVLRSGFGSSLYPVTADTKAQWLSGGNTVWRRCLFNEFKFDENLKGYGFVDDLDFSYSAGKKYKLFVLADANIKHFSTTEYTNRIFRFGLMEVISRRYFLRKHDELSLVLFYWAHLGLIITGVLSSITHLNFNYFKRACGNVIGTLYTLIHRKASAPAVKNNNIRVALLCTSINQMGGKNVHFKNMYLNLNGEDISVIILLSSSLEKEHRNFMIQEGVKEDDVILIPRFKKWLIVPFILELRKILIKRKINIAHTFQIQSDIFGAIAACMAGIDCVISQQDSKAIEENISLPKSLFYRLSNACLMNFFKKTVAVSESLKRELVAEKFRSAEKIEVIPVGIAVPEEHRDREFSFEGLRKKTPLIGTIARLNKEKGISRFVNAMPFILGKIPHAKFLIVGKGDERTNLQEQVKRLGLNSKVEFRELPWSEPVSNVLTTIDIFVMPSLREGCPIALLEALAFSRPVVASKTGGISDIIEDGKNGLMIDTSDPRLFAEKVIFLCEHPDIAMTMGKAGREKILNNFTLELEMERFRKLYKGCVDRRLINDVVEK